MAGETPDPRLRDAEKDIRRASGVWKKDRAADLHEDLSDRAERPASEIEMPAHEPELEARTVLAHGMEALDKSQGAEEKNPLADNIEPNAAARQQAEEDLKFTQSARLVRWVPPAEAPGKTEAVTAYEVQVPGFLAKKEKDAAPEPAGAYKKFAPRIAEDFPVTGETPHTTAALNILKSEVGEGKIHVNEGQILKALIMAAGGQGAWEKFVAEYRRAEPKTGAEIHRFQEQWAQKNIGIDLYGEAAILKQFKNIPTIAEVTAGTLKPENDKRFLDMIGSFRYEIAVRFDMNRDALAAEPRFIRELYGISGVPGGWGEPGSTIEFNPERGAFLFLAKDGTQVAQFDRPPQATIAEFKKNYPQLQVA